MPRVDTPFFAAASAAAATASVVLCIAIGHDWA